ncbi:unnamed protein product [Moneuplotes crassus]|uniref:Uncharacterized protein n=1 Tax=Euplotes crassus TaxID=5936 RepID=A0AAD1U954_EUPCR|nr:unnamed protein product [Moneuplotes crassus]
MIELTPLAQRILAKIKLLKETDKLNKVLRKVDKKLNLKKQKKAIIILPKRKAKLNATIASALKSSKARRGPRKKKFNSSMKLLNLKEIATRKQGLPPSSTQAVLKKVIRSNTNQMQDVRFGTLDSIKNNDKTPSKFFPNKSLTEKLKRSHQREFLRADTLNWSQNSTKIPKMFLQRKTKLKPNHFKKFGNSFGRPKEGLVGLSKLLFDQKKRQEIEIKRRFKVINTHDEKNGAYITRLRASLSKADIVNEVKMLENCRIMPTTHSVVLTSKPPHVSAENIYNNVVYDMVRNRKKNWRSRSAMYPLAKDNFEEIPEYLERNKLELQTNVFSTAKSVMQDIKKKEKEKLKDATPQNNIDSVVSFQKLQITEINKIIKGLVLRGEASIKQMKNDFLIECHKFINNFENDVKKLRKECIKISNTGPIDIAASNFLSSYNTYENVLSSGHKEQAELIFQEKRNILIRDYISKINDFEAKIIGKKQLVNKEYEEQTIQKLYKLFNDELTKEVRLF